jgi:hypothetical protein
LFLLLLRSITALLCDKSSDQADNRGRLRDDNEQKRAPDIIFARLGSMASKQTGESVAKLPPL